MAICRTAICVCTLYMDCLVFMGSNQMGRRRSGLKGIRVKSDRRINMGIYCALRYLQCDPRAWVGSGMALRMLAWACWCIGSMARDEMIGHGMGWDRMNDA